MLTTFFTVFIYTPVYNETFKDTIIFNGSTTHIDKADNICGETPLNYIRSIIPEFRTKKINRTAECIITAFDRSHEAEASSMIISMTQDCYRARLLIYDFGISNEYTSVFVANHYIELISVPQVIPDFARTFERHNKGFKPFVIADAIARGCETVYWADASTRSNGLCTNGVLFEKKISLMYMNLSNREYTHPAMYRFFTTTRADDDSMQFESGNILFNTSYTFSLDILCRWMYCCMQKQCVLPDGALIKPFFYIPVIFNGFKYRVHRDDQSALNLALLDAIKFRNMTTDIGMLNARVRGHATDVMSSHELSDMLGTVQKLEYSEKGMGIDIQ